MSVRCSGSWVRCAGHIQPNHAMMEGRLDPASIGAGQRRRDDRPPQGRTRMPASPTDQPRNHDHDSHRLHFDRHHIWVPTRSCPDESSRPAATYPPHPDRCPHRPRPSNDASVDGRKHRHTHPPRCTWLAQPGRPYAGVGRVHTDVARRRGCRWCHPTLGHEAQSCSPSAISQLM
jgi:hypothetical protein